MKTIRLATACLAISANVLCAQLPPSLAGGPGAVTGSPDTIEKTLTGAKWDVDMELGHRNWGNIIFREGHEFTTMNGPNGQWKVAGDRKVALGSLYVLEFAPGLESFVATRNDGVKIATGKRKGATAATPPSPMKTAPAAPAALPQPPLPNLSTPGQQTAQRHAQEVAAHIAALQAPFTTIAAEAEKAGKDVTATYLSALDQLQGQKAAAGDIDGVVAIKEERDRVANREQPTAAQLQAMSQPVRKLRATYETDTKKAADQAVLRNDLARRTYLANLEALQKRLNATGEIEQGLLVKAEKDRFIAELAAGKGTVIQPAGSPSQPAQVAITRPVMGVAKPVNQMMLVGNTLPKEWLETCSDFVAICQAKKKIFLVGRYKVGNALIGMEAFLKLHTPSNSQPTPAPISETDIQEFSRRLDDIKRHYGYCATFIEKGAKVPIFEDEAKISKEKVRAMSNTWEVIETSIKTGVITKSGRR
jgi:hypothetical protein